ncbi:MAG: FixH family protein [Burkholderiales bacterium]
MASAASAGLAAETCATPAGFAPQSRLESADFVLHYRPVPAPIVLGRHFAIDVVVCAKAASPAVRGLRVDATMPEHRHGMNYRATVAAKGGGRYVAEGLLFHMPGRWQLLFDVEARGSAARLATDIVLE